MPGEVIAAKFVAAWEVFSRTCATTVAPEATYQAWFAHYLISQFGIDRVAREPDFGHHSFTSPLTKRFSGHEMKLDAVVTRVPGIAMPHRAHRNGRDVGGLPLLADLAVIAELKVASTQGQGLDQSGVARDVWKRSTLLTEADRHDMPAPLACVCILDNHPKRTYSRRDWIRRHAATLSTTTSNRSSLATVPPTDDHVTHRLQGPSCGPPESSQRLALGPPGECARPRRSGSRRRDRAHRPPVLI